MLKICRNLNYEALYYIPRELAHVIPTAKYVTISAMASKASIPISEVHMHEAMYDAKNSFKLSKCIFFVQPRLQLCFNCPVFMSFFPLSDISTI